MRERFVGVGAGEQHQHIGAGAERAPRLDAVDHVPIGAVGAGGWGRGDLEPGDVAAEVGLRDRDGRHHLGGGELGQPLELLLLRPALDEGTGEDLRTRDQRAADPEARPAELLGGDDHGDVLAVAALGETAVFGRYGESERTDLGEAADDLLGDVAVRPMDVLGVRGDDVRGERAERVLDHLHVGVEMARPRSLGERRHEVRIAVGAQRGQRGIECARRDAPQRLAPGDAADQVVDHVGGECTGDRRLGVTLGAVVEQRPCRRRGRAGVGDVVGEHLAGVRPAALAEDGSAPAITRSARSTSPAAAVRSGAASPVEVPVGRRHRRESYRWVTSAPQSGR